MYKAYKFRLYPNEEQTVLIHKTFGCYRFIYNYFLDVCKKNGYKKAFDMCKSLKEFYNIYTLITIASRYISLNHLALSSKDISITSVLLIRI